MPVDEDRRDREFESFQATYRGGDGRHVGEEAVENPDEVDEELDADEELADRPPR